MVRGRLRPPLSLSFLAAVGACNPDAASSPADVQVRPAFAAGQCTPPAVAGTTRPFDCAESILVLYEGGRADVTQAIDGAVLRWNAAFEAERGHAVPEFARISEPVAALDTSGQRRTVRVVLHGTGAAWCDATDVSGAGKGIDLYPAGPQCDGNVGSLDAVMLHAFGHALGLSSVPMHKQGVVGISDHCAIFLPEGSMPNAGGINDQLCQHEVDIVLMIYGAYPADLPGDRFAFWGKHILSRVGLPDSLRLREDETRVLNPVGPYFANAQNPPGVAAPSLLWVSDPADVASVGSGNLLEPRKAGFVRIRAVVAAEGLPSSVRRSVRLREGSTGHQVDVNVTPAVWAPGFQVTNILGPPAPLSGGQSSAFTTTVVNSGGYENLQVTWRLIRSYAPTDTQVVASTPNSLSAYVPEGSYSLRVIATPRDIVSGNTGGSFVRDYPVCTDQVLFGGGASTNLPEGCGSPPIQ